MQTQIASENGIYEMSDYRLPDPDMLKADVNEANFDGNEQEKVAERIIEALKSFGKTGKIVKVSRGAAITRYEVQPDQGVLVAKIAELTEELGLAIGMKNIRIDDPEPGTRIFGVEIPNTERALVRLHDLIVTDEFKNNDYMLPFAVGKDVEDNPTVIDLAKMPHILLVGVSASGKTVCLNSLIKSILFKSRPDEVKLILVDTKSMEYSIYSEIPHLMEPVIIDPHKATESLNWCVSETNRRKNEFAKHNVRDLDEYSALRDSNELRPIPRIVVIIDELADLMCAERDNVEAALIRVAQEGESTGIHLAIATQRPSTDVLTGLIKANLLSRIAFKVSSEEDSEFILETLGAERLLGMGDMLFYPKEYNKPLRLQGAFITEEEEEKVASFVRAGGEK